ncbi:MAG: DUF928 domain-containing protein [Cyanobacteria bacterium SBLK]|nr:DUF928 domain-containing protein [Cyanobacteria bacterium SBLK]
MNHLKLRTLFAVCLSWQILSLGISPRVEAQEQTPQNPLAERLVFNEAFEPTEGERPKTRGAGSRGKCTEDTEAIIPLIPPGQYGLTFEERPSIFIQTPKTVARSLLLVFENKTEGFYEEAMLPISQTSGIVSFALPDRFPPLETGKTYEWRVAFVCGEEISVDDPFFKGYVTRITRTPAIEAELAQKTEIERAKWYAEGGYWYDLLSTMVRARQESPDNSNLKILWESLLHSVGLEDSASQPLTAID